MKILMALFGVILLSGCAGNEEGEFLYSFNQIDHSKIVTDTVIEDRLDVSVKEDGIVLKEEALDELFLNIEITNQSNEELVVGSDLSLEKYINGKWENVDPEDFTMTTMSYDFLPEDTFSYGVNLFERLERDSQSLDGVFRLTNAEVIYMYFSLGRFVQ